MKNWLLRYATPLTTGLFLISLISGIALFFGIAQGTFHSMHEWLSMVLIVPFVLHLWRNWTPLVNYFKRSAMPIALAFSVIMAVAFVVWPAGAEGGARQGPPQFAFASAVIAASPAEVAPVFGVTTDKLVADLKAQGFTSADADTALTDIATASGKSPMELYTLLMAEKP